MTKVQMRFRLLRPLNELLLSRISDAHSIYGIFRVALNPSMEQLTVEYDATRLAPKEVEAAMAAAGFPVETMA